MKKEITRFYVPLEDEQDKKSRYWSPLSLFVSIVFFILLSLIVILVVCSSVYMIRRVSPAKTENIALNFTQNQKLLNRDFLVNVSYDHKSIIIDGKRQLLIAGAIHYPRSTPGMWPHLIKKSKEAGINTIDTYVFWNVHEPVKRHYDFNGNANILEFLEIVKKENLYVNLRIGPYICAEWNYGGLPAWLRDEHGLEIRTYNSQFMDEMKIFVKKIVELIRPYLVSNGGNIVLMQIENEYGNVQSSYGSDGAKYIMWAADLANSLNTGVPWIMCLNDNVPTVISTCNGFYCDNWIGSRPKKNEPAIFTELWSGWFQFWNQEKPTRSSEDVALAATRWVAKGGSYFSYYMWHGGTNFARWGAGYQSTSYDYDAPLNEHGFTTKKYYHLAKLHYILNQNADLILESDPMHFLIGDKKEIHLYSNHKNSTRAIAFVSNMQGLLSSIEFYNQTFNVAPWSVLVLTKSSHNQSFNIAYSTSETLPVPNMLITSNVDQATSKIRINFKNLDIRYIQDEIGIWNKSASIRLNTTIEQLSLTHDKTDYMWYTLSNISSVEAQQLIEITLNQVSDVWYAWFDDIPLFPFPASVFSEFENKEDVKLSAIYSNPVTKSHKLTILSCVMGLKNEGPHYDQIKKGLVNEISINKKLISNGSWRMQTGMKGEHEKYFASYIHNHLWKAHNLPLHSFMTWYKIKIPSNYISQMMIDSGTFDQHTQGQKKGFFGSFSLKLSSMGKGQAWVNQHNIGRYWKFNAQQTDRQSNGRYNQTSGAIQNGQAYYHVPMDWMLDSEGRVADVNIVLFEELGGNPHLIELVYLFNVD